MSVAAGSGLTLADAENLQDCDPVRDKSYERARLAPAVTAWLTYRQLDGKAARTLEDDERSLARLCLLVPGKDISEITDGDLLVLAAGWTEKQRRERMSPVRMFFQWAKKTRKITDNPCEYLPDFKRVAQKMIDVFEDWEVERLLGLPIIDAAPMGCLLEAGLRKAEARSLTEKDCGAENSQLIVRRGKGGKGRVVPMSRRLVGLLSDLVLFERLDREDHIFYAVRANEVSSTRIRRFFDKDGQPRPTGCGDGTFHRWWERCLHEAGVRYRNPHTARHTFATRWLRDGGRLETLSRAMGHSSIATTFDLYGHLDTRDAIRDLELIEAARAR